MRRLGLGALGLAFVFLIKGCGGRESTGTATVWDSAGVRIVEHGGLSDSRAFKVGTPLFRIGWSEDEHNFVRVTSGALGPDGTIAVGDIGASEVVTIDPDGLEATVLAGSGEGPEEIGQVISVNWLPGDTVVVEDDGNTRISFFTDGSFARSYRFPGGSLAMRSLGRIGRALVMVTSQFRLYFDEPWLQGTIASHSLDTSGLDSIATFDLASHIVEGEPINPFRPFGQVGVTADFVLVTRADLGLINMLDIEGQLQQSIRWHEAPRVMSEEAWTKFADAWDAAAGGMPEEQRNALMQEAREGVDGPLPLLGEVRGDDVGRVWVSLYSTDYRHPERYRVFGPDGSWLGWVDLPPRTQVLDIRGDQLLVIQRNEFDAEAIAVLPLIARD